MHEMEESNKIHLFYRFWYKYKVRKRNKEPYYRKDIKDSIIFEMHIFYNYGGNRFWHKEIILED